MKKVLITGITGQDGSYLAELLLEKGYEVHGLVRRSASYAMKNIDHIKDQITMHWGDLETDNHLALLIQKLQPDELYNLAAQSDVKISYEIPEYTANVTGLGTIRLLESLRYLSPHTRFYQASSSEMFGNTKPPQSESGPFNPRNPYAVAKLYSHQIAGIYREAYSLFITCGILFNHESPRRGMNFVTRKISHGVAEIAKGKRQTLVLGNLDAKRDWGYAPDYVLAMWMILQQPKPTDFVIGTGEAHSVKEFLVEAFSVVNLDWQKFTQVDQKFFRPTETDHLLANPKKANDILGWKPTLKFKDMVRIMVESDLKTME